ncbi:tetratricopeptide repeat protein [Planctomycetaceae bacterium SH139]
MSSEPFSTAIRRCQLTGWLVAGCLLLPLADIAQGTPPAEGQLETGLAELARGNHAVAAEILAAEVARLTLQPTAADTPQLPNSTGQPNSATAGDGRQQAANLGRAMIGAGQALRQLGRHEEAAEFFHAAIELPLLGRRLAPLQLALAESQLEAGKAAAATEVCKQILASAVTPGEEAAARSLLIRALLVDGQIADCWLSFQQATGQQDTSGQPASDVAADSDAESELRRTAVTNNLKHWTSLANTIGLAALSGDEPQIASQAFQWVLQQAPPASEPVAGEETATLGVAWAAAKGAESLETAAARLETFIERFPDSPQLPRAKLALGGCLRRNNQNAAAITCFRNLVAAHPNSQAAARALGELTELSPQEPLVAEMLPLLQRLISEDATPLSPQLLATAMLSAATHQNETLWELASARFQAEPATSSLLGQLLDQLTRVEQTEQAARLVDDTLRHSDTRPEPAIEQVCRWAAGLGKWDLLAGADNLLSSDQQLANLSPTSIRLFAEAKMQSNQLVEAQRLFTYLIDKRSAGEFDTLLRFAELSLTLDPKAQAATAIERAGQVVSAREDEQLVQLLRAQWLIRDAQLEPARELLTQFLQQPEVDRQLKARAQWLIGETHFLQRDYAAAVDAYRVVESLDDSGHWTAAALLQAGRGFEQLGRTREATICYTGLLTRFAGTPFAANASHRLAALGEQPKLR